MRALHKRRKRKMPRQPKGIIMSVIESCRTIRISHLLLGPRIFFLVQSRSFRFRRFGFLKCSKKYTETLNNVVSFGTCKGASIHCASFGQGWRYSRGVRQEHYYRKLRQKASETASRKYLRLSRMHIEDLFWRRTPRLLLLWRTVEAHKGHAWRKVSVRVLYKKGERDVAGERIAVTKRILAKFTRKGIEMSHYIRYLLPR